MIARSAMELSDEELDDLIAEKKRRLRAKRLGEDAYLPPEMFDSERGGRPTGLTFIYCRVSTTGQEYGLAAQLDACLAYCAKEGLVVGPSDAAVDEAVEFLKRSIESKEGRRQSWTVPHGCRLYVDKGESGAKKLSNRPAGRLLLHHLQRGDVVVVNCLSRLGRSALDIMGRLHELIKLGVSVRVVNQRGAQFDLGTAVGQMIAWLMVIIHQFQHQLTKEQTIAARRAGMADGRIHSHNPPKELGRQHGSRVDPKTGRRVQLVRDCPNEKLMMGYIAHWHWIDGISQKELYVRLRTPRWSWVRKLGKHRGRGPDGKNHRGRGNLCVKTIDRGCRDAVAKGWIALARADMHRRDVSISPEVPPVETWKWKKWCRNTAFVVAMQAKLDGLLAEAEMRKAGGEFDDE